MPRKYNTFPEQGVLHAWFSISCPLPCKGWVWSWHNLQPAGRFVLYYDQLHYDQLYSVCSNYDQLISDLLQIYNIWFYFIILNHGIKVYSDYLQAKLNIRRTLFVFCVWCHEIICGTTHPALMSVGRPKLSLEMHSVSLHYSQLVSG